MIIRQKNNFNYQTINLKTAGKTRVVLTPWAVVNKYLQL